nr:immunoglobulin heavy chain junction region [Mus musculus]MBK4198353.1 immunoglobulin heavy chain junction region [Mus musculus]
CARHEKVYYRGGMGYAMDYW